MTAAQLQHPNVYNERLPHSSSIHGDSGMYLQEIRVNLAKAVLNNDTGQCVVWVVNLHKYIILYGLAFTREEHVFLIKVLFGLLITKNTDPVSLDKFAKVLFALLKKKYLIPRSELILDWGPLFTLYQFWEDSSPAVRGLLKCPAGFKLQIKSVIKVCRGYFSDSSTEEMLTRWKHLLCPADRSMSMATRYFSLFLPTTKDISPSLSWELWLPLFQSYWQTWGNSPAWEVDLLRLYSRLATHRVGQVDWEKYMPDLYTRFMASFNLPVTYGGSGVHIKHGISGTSCLGSMTKWIVSSLGGGSTSQSHLSSLLGAVQSYYHPANSNNSSELLHVFISCLCTYFLDRVHLERHNTKWVTKVPPDKQLTDTDIEIFVSSVKPIAFLVLYNNYEDEARSVFQSLALLSPSTIIPPLLDRLAVAADTLTEPHRFHVCIQAMSATAGPLVRNYPVRALELLHSLLPGIDVNDIWKCTDIFILMSDLLEMMPVKDMGGISMVGFTDKQRDLVEKTRGFENFVVEFMNRCFTLIENSRRENFRSDGASGEEYLNDEEIAADAAINDTFLRMCVNSSPNILNTIFSKLTTYLAGKIVEPTVAGGILASMCRSLVHCDTVKGLKFFIPTLVRSVLARMKERGEGGKTIETGNKLDEELQFKLQLLGEVLSVKNVGVFRCRGADILPWVEDICTVLDCTISLGQKDEYELSHIVLSGLLTWLCHTRLVETGDRVGHLWGEMVSPDSIPMEWYVPGDQEMMVVNDMLERYLAPVISKLDLFAKGEVTLEKEELQRNLKLVLKILTGVSELIEPEKKGKWESVLSSNLGWMERVNIKLGGQSVRVVVNKLMCRVQDKLVMDKSDDTESFTGILYVFDMLLFCYGMDEDEIGDHIEDHKREKLHREDKLVRGKKHLPSVHLERITLQWETQVWLKNLLVMESLPSTMLEHIFGLCIHLYSEVRVVAQELFLKLVGRVGKCCHPIVLPLLVGCLANSPSTTDETLKGALYLINSEKHMFFYSWEAASSIWPALVTAQHSDKQSVDDLLRDIGIKANRYYQDYNMYTLPLSDPILPPGVVELVKSNTGLAGEGGFAQNTIMRSQVHYQQLETRLVQLVGGKTLHWRHQEMAVGMLLSMITYDHTPSLPTTSLWLSLLLSDQRTIRLMAYQALEGILKLSKLPSVKVPLTELVPACHSLNVSKPGIREDNMFLQYQGNMEQGELETYWNKPFIVKSYIGYLGWPGEKANVRKIHPVEHFLIQPESVRGLIAEFFMDESRVKTFVEFNSLEHEKGADFFSTDRGLFLSFLLENIGPGLALVFQPHIEKLVGSPEESQQRAAAEMVYGLVRGSRFWDYNSSSQLWGWLLPVFQQVLNNVTAETQSDWDFCFSGASNKADPNRLRALYELLITSENLVSQGAFKESSYLLFVAKCLSMNWRVKELYCRTYNILRDHWAHPYNNVRHQIASTMATLTSMDIPWAGIEGGNVGQGFPTKKLFIDEVIPCLNLNSPNPEFSSSRSLSPASVNTSHSSSEDVSMEGAEDDDTKRSNRTLEMVSLWICHQIRLSSASLDPVLYSLLPYLCQFIGTERDQDVSQSCLQALCYLSACILPNTAIQPLLNMVKRIAMSESYKTKMSMLEFLQVAVFTNFPSLVCSPVYRNQVTSLTTSLLSDPHITVRQKAAKILGGLLHSGFLSGSSLDILLCDLRGRVRTKMTRQGKRFRKEEGDQGAQDKLNHHSGVLGLCAFVEAFPYDVPEFVPPILMELSTHLNDPQPIPMTIKKSLQEFKRTHQDNWQEHKTKFTEDQLVVMTDLLVSQNYYA